MKICYLCYLLMMKQLFMVISLRGVVVTDQIANRIIRKVISGEMTSACEIPMTQENTNWATSHLANLLFFVVFCFFQLSRITFQERSIFINNQWLWKQQKTKKIWSTNLTPKISRTSRLDYAFCRGPPKFQMDEDYTSTFELEIEIVGCVQVT